MRVAVVSQAALRGLAVRLVERVVVRVATGRLQLHHERRHRQLRGRAGEHRPESQRRAQKRSPASRSRHRAGADWHRVVADARGPADLSKARRADEGALEAG